MNPTAGSQDESALDPTPPAPARAGRREARPPADGVGGGDDERSWEEHIRSRLDAAADDAEGFAPTEDLPTWEDWREYLQLVSWLVPDVYRHARLRTLGLVLLSAVGVGARAATAGTMLLYVHAQNEGRAVQLLGYTLPSEANLATYLMWGGAALCFALLTVWASYRADALIFELGRSYMEASTRRVMRYVAAGGRVNMPDDPTDAGVRPIMRLLVGSTFRLVRVVIQSFSMLLPLITLGVCVAVLLATNAVLTSILIPVMIGYAIAMSRLNRQVIRDSQRRELTRRIHSRDVAKMVRTLQRTRYAADAQPEWLRSYPERSWMDLAMRSFRGIVLAKRRVDYLGDAFQGIAMLLVLMVFGTYIASEGTSWAVLLTYMIAFGYAVKSLGRASKCVTTANRFLPQVRRYFTFIEAHPDLDAYASRVSGGLPDGLPVFRTADPALPESRHELPGRAGEPILCVGSRPAENEGLGELCFALANGDAARAVELDSELFFQRGTAPLPEREVWELLPATDDRASRWKRVVELMGALGVLEEFRENFGGPDGVLDTERDKLLSHPLRYALRLVPGIGCGARLIALGWDNLEPLDDAQRRAVLDLFADRLVLVVADEPPKEIPAEIRHTLVAGAESVLGIGDADWFVRVAQPHLQQLGDETTERSGLVLDGEDYADDEVDED